MILQDGASGPLPGWWPEALLWLMAGILLAATAAALCAWALLQRLNSLGQEAKTLAVLHDLKRTLDRWLAAREDLDLRRIEHLLIELRDGSRRLEESLLRGQEQRSSETEALVPRPNPGLGERVVNRLLALGYERVELVAGSEELAALDGADGDILVEARRDGVLCKGKVRVRGGRIDAVHVQPAFPVFP